MGRGWGEEWRRSALQGCTALEMFFFPFAPVDSPSTVSIFRGDARCFSSTTWHASTVALNCTVLDYNVADSPPSTDRTVGGPVSVAALLPGRTPRSRWRPPRPPRGAPSPCHPHPPPARSPRSPRSPRSLPHRRVPKRGGTGARLFTKRSRLHRQTSHLGERRNGWHWQRRRWWRRRRQQQRLLSCSASPPPPLLSLLLPCQRKGLSFPPLTPPPFPHPELRHSSPPQTTHGGLSPPAPRPRVGSHGSAVHRGRPAAATAVAAASYDWPPPSARGLSGGWSRQRHRRCRCGPRRRRRWR